MLYPPPQKHSVVGKAYFLSNFFSLRDHALLHKGLFFERPISNQKPKIQGYQKIREQFDFTTKISSITAFSLSDLEQESIPVGCILPACQPYVFQWPPVDASSSGEGGRASSEQV